VPYLDNYWSDSFGPKYDPSVFGVLQLLEYFANFLIFFTSHAISNFQKCQSLAMATLWRVTPASRTSLWRHVWLLACAHCSPHYWAHVAQCRCCRGKRDGPDYKAYWPCTTRLCALSFTNYLSPCSSATGRCLTILRQPWQTIRSSQTSAPNQWNLDLHFLALEHCVFMHFGEPFGNIVPE